MDESIVLTRLILLKMELFNIIFTAMTIIILNKIIGHSEDDFNEVITDHYDDDEEDYDYDDGSTDPAPATTSSFLRQLHSLAATIPGKHVLMMMIMMIMMIMMMIMIMMIMMMVTLMKS